MTGRGDMETLKDWCFEAPYNILSTPIRTAQQMGYRLDSKVETIILYMILPQECRLVLYTYPRFLNK